MSRPLNDDEIEAIATLARRGRVIAVLVPGGIPIEVVEMLTLEISARLDAWPRMPAGLDAWPEYRPPRAARKP